MNNLVSSTTGLIHLITAIVALIFGTLVLIKRRGTVQHKRLGYVYAASMLVLNITAFLIYRLFGRFGPFHIAAVISLTTLLTGLLPAMIRKPKRDWIWFHMAGMYYSVMGLYSAFVSEVVVRIPGAPFFTVIIIATLLIFGVAVWWFKKHSEQWAKDFLAPGHLKK